MRIVTAAIIFCCVALLARSASASASNDLIGGFMTFAGGTSDTGNGMCIENDSGTLKQQPCSASGNAESWALHGNGTIHYYVNGSDTNECIDIYANNPANGTLDVTTCNGTQAQVWSFSNGVLSSYYHSGYCMNVTGGSESAGTVIGITSCASEYQQLFLPLAFTLKITNNSTGGCLDVHYNDKVVGEAIGTYSCNTTSAQSWSFGIAETAYYSNTAYYHAILYNQYDDGSTTALCAGSSSAPSELSQMTLEECSDGKGWEQVSYGLDHDIPMNYVCSACSGWPMGPYASGSYNVEYDKLTIFLSSADEWSFTIRGL